MGRGDSPPSAGEGGKERMFFVPSSSYRKLELQIYPGSQYQRQTSSAGSRDSTLVVTAFFWFPAAEGGRTTSRGHGLWSCYWNPPTLRKNVRAPHERFSMGRNSTGIEVFIYTRETHRNPMQNQGVFFKNAIYCLKKNTHKNKIKIWRRAERNQLISAKGQQNFQSILEKSLSFHLCGAYFSFWAVTF